ncbi:MAG: nitrilase-related carbon-nitrogen hydrolase [Thermoflexales bacterium]
MLEAAEKGATIAAFGETWLPGYPFFCWSRQSELWFGTAADYIANAFEIPSPTTDKLCAAAKQAGIDVVIGVAELDSRTQSTVYCTLLFISREGEILGRHCKLKPTSAERTIWGDGDALGLKVHQRSYTKVSGLNCWEHNMVLPGYALMSEGTQIHIAAWSGGGKSPTPFDPIMERQLLLSRAFASQAGCYVIAAGGLRLKEHTPERLHNMHFDRTGDGYIIDPTGEVIAGPAVGETILIAKGSLENVRAAKAATDAAGHYSRPDIFRFSVNRGANALD